MRLLLTTFLILTVLSCSRTKGTVGEQEKKDSLTSDNKTPDDSLLVAVLKYDTSYNYIFSTVVTSTDLSDEEIKICEVLLGQYINDYNLQATKRYNEMTREHPDDKLNLKNFTIELEEYGRQYIAVISKQGDKVVYVNCLCDPTLYDSWETDLIRVLDGGNCYFNFKVNLTTKKIFDFIENGDA